MASSECDSAFLERAMARSVIHSIFTSATKKVVEMTDDEKTRWKKRDDDGLKWAPVTAGDVRPEAIFANEKMGTTKLL